MLEGDSQGSAAQGSPKERLERAWGTRKYEADFDWWTGESEALMRDRANGGSPLQYSIRSSAKTHDPAMWHVLLSVMKKGGGTLCVSDAPHSWSALRATKCAALGTERSKCRAVGGLDQGCSWPLRNRYSAGFNAKGCTHSPQEDRQVASIPAPYF